MKNRFTPLHRVLLAAALVAGATLTAQAQNGVGIGTTAPDASAALDIVSTTKGALLPRVASTASVASPATGLIVFQTAAPAGYYYYTGSVGGWQQIATASGAAVTASNGLTKTGQNIALGGTLTGATNIAQAGNNLTLTGGNVGIGTSTPVGVLSVGGTATGTAAIDQQQLVSGASTGGTDQWQSFTAGVSGNLTQIDMRVSSPTGANGAPGTLSIYAGQGTGGALLTSQAIVYNNVINTYQQYPLGTPVAVVAGQQYTYRFQTPTITVTFVDLSTANPYAGGQANVSSSWDYCFKTYVATLTTTDVLTALASGNVGIGTAAPTALLDVNGSTRLRGLTTAGVVTTDGSGNLSSGTAASLDPTTASNGLTKVGSDFRLGGTLTQATTVAQATNFFALTGGQVGVGTATAPLNSRLSVQTSAAAETGLNVGLTGASTAIAFKTEHNGSNFIVRPVSAGGTSTAIENTGGGALAINPTIGNVGIGTTSPSQKLDVVGTTNVSAAIVVDAAAGNTGTFVNSTAPANNGLRFGAITSGEGIASKRNVGGNSTGLDFYTAYVNRLAITNGGNVGIGTTAPVTQLSNTTTNILGNDANGISTQSLNWVTTTGGYAAAFASAAPDGFGNNNGLAVKVTGTSGTALDISSGPLSGSGTSLLRVASTGNVGIGTNAPTQKLDVNGNVRIEGLTAGVVSAAADGTLSSSSATTAFGTSFIQNQNTTDQAANFRINGTGSTLGSFGVGTAAPLAKLAVAGAQVLYSGLNNASARPAVGLARIAGEIGAVGQVATATPDLNADDGFLRLSAGGGGNLARKSYIDLSGFSNNADMNENITFGTINAERMRITNTGNVGIGTATPNNLLDLGTTFGSSPTAAATKKLAVFNSAAGDNFYGLGVSSGQLNLFAGGASTAAPGLVLNANGNVGIGTITPTQALDVNGGILARTFNPITNQGAHLQWNRTGFEGETWLINTIPTGIAQNYGIRFGNSDVNNTVTEWARFDRNGNFSIGVPFAGGAGPGANKLDVNGSTRLRGLTTAGVVTTDASGNLSSGTAASLDPTTASNGLTKVGSDFRLGGTLAAATTIGLGANNLSFTSTTGNVGIGTTTPVTRLSISQVTSQSNTPGQNLGELSFVGFNRPNPSASIQALGRDFDDTGHLIFKTSPGGTGATERVRITADGNVGIGTTTPRTPLEVNGIGLFGGGTAPTTGNTAGVAWNAVRPGNGEMEFLDYKGLGFGGFRFYSIGGTGTPGAGNVVAYIDGSSGFYNQLSDRRVKTGITTLNQGLRQVMALRPVAYDLHTKRELKDGVVTFLPGDKTVHSLGFVAQELYNVVPEAVNKPQDERKELYTVSYTTLVPVLTQAIQEQQKEIEALKARNAALEGRAATAEGRAAQADADHASLLTLQAQMARLLGDTAPANAQARK